MAALALLACTTSVSPQPEAERRAQAVDNSLICPICPGETIDRSQVQLAKDMQAIVRVQIDEGRTDEEIRQFFVDRYGERVLAAPPREGFHWLVWAAPPVGVVLALLTLFWVTQAMGRRPPEPPLAEGDTDADLAPYLLQVDRELSSPSLSATPRRTRWRPRPAIVFPAKAGIQGPGEGIADEGAPQRRKDTGKDT